MVGVTEGREIQASAGEPGVACLGGALALVLATAALVHAVDQPGPLPGLDRDERGERHALGAAACQSPSPPESGRAGPRCGPWAALSPDQTRPRRRSRRPGPQ